MSAEDVTDAGAPSAPNHQPPTQPPVPGKDKVADKLTGAVEDVADISNAATQGASLGAKVGGATGAAIGGVAGGVGAALKNRRTRNLILGALALLLAINIALVHVTLSTISAGLTAVGQQAEARFAGISSFASGLVSGTADLFRFDEYEAGAKGSPVPAYMLAAIEINNPHREDDDNNPFGIINEDWPTDRAAAGALITQQLHQDVYNGSREAGREFNDLDWSLVTGMIVGRDGVWYPSTDPEQITRREHMITVWEDAVAKLPIEDADQKARPIVAAAARLAVGESIDGCGTFGSGYATNPTGITVGDGVWVNPVVGRTTSEFGMRRHPVTGVYKLHSGSDVGAPKGTPVYAASNGTVTGAGNVPGCGDGACGAVIEITHGSGIRTWYLHMAYSDHRVKKGDQVAAGQQIGAVNSMGYSTGAHLHFEVHVNGRPIDPVPFLKDRGVTYGTGTPTSMADAVLPPSVDEGGDDDGEEVGGDEAKITGPIQLKDKNGTTQTLSVQAQKNASIAIGTIKAANWPGVTEQDKQRLMVMALITMGQESFFGTHPTSGQPDSNHDTGPYQQRALPGWYADAATEAENNKILQDVAYGTLTFIEGHKVKKAYRGGAGPVGYTIPGVFQQKNWRTGEPWEVVANVQVPAKQYRILYDKWTPIAESLIASLDGTIVNIGTGSNLYGCDSGSAGALGAVQGEYSLQQPGPWGGYKNGEIPASALCSETLGGVTVKLRCDAAMGLHILNTEWKRFGGGTADLKLLPQHNGYLSTSQQASCKAATTGRCEPNHGWALAVDFDTSAKTQMKWLKSNTTSSWQAVGAGGHYEYFALGGEVATDGWEKGLKPAALYVRRHVLATWPEIKTIGGHREGGTPDHPSGRAIDVMIPDYKSAAGNALGWEIAKSLQADASKLGISYLIFDEKIWSVARDKEGWRPYNSKSSNDSARHIDHVHVNVY